MQPGTFDSTNIPSPTYLYKRLKHFSLEKGRPQGRYSSTLSISTRKRHFFRNLLFIITSLLILQSQGKMKLHIFLLLLILVVCDSIKSNPELQRNILKFGYGINYKYKGMLAHSFNRFYIVMKFMLPSVKDIKFYNLNFDESCAYMNKKYAPHTDSSKYLSELQMYCNKTKPFVLHYSKLIVSCNTTVHNILANEIRPLLPQICKQKCGLITTLVSGFIGLAYEGISSFLQKKCNNALQKAMIAMNGEAEFQCNKL